MAYQRRPRQEDPNTGAIERDGWKQYRPDPTSPPGPGAPRQLKSTLGGIQERGTQYKPPDEVTIMPVKSTLGGEQQGTGVRPPTFAEGAYRPQYMREPRYEYGGPNLQAPAPRWRLDEVRDTNPDFVIALKQRLVEKLNQLPANERAVNAVFWDNVKGNPEGAAAAITARLMDNLTPFMNERAPMLNDAARARLSQSRISRWLGWADTYRGF